MMRSLSLLDGMKEKVRTRPSSLFDSVKRFNKKDKEDTEEERPRHSRKQTKQSSKMLRAIGAS